MAKEIKNDSKSLLSTIQGIVNNLPLEMILTQVEALQQKFPENDAKGLQKLKGKESEEDDSGAANMLPKVLTVVEKLLKKLIALRPIASSLLEKSAIGGTSAALKASMSCESNSDEETMDPAKAKEMLMQLIVLAVEDGELTPEEVQSLQDVADDAGVSEDELVEMIKNNMK